MGVGSPRALRLTILMLLYSNLIFVSLNRYFSMLANLLQCDVMLLIMHTVLKRAIDLKARSFSESHLQKVCYNAGH